MQVIVVERNVTDSWNAPPPVFLAVAKSENAAKKWIQDEVDGHHNTSHSYMQGKDADWWIAQGTFSLKSVYFQTEE